MKSASLLLHVRQAFSKLNPNQVRTEAEKQVTIEIAAPNEERYAAIEHLLIPDTVTPAKRAAARSAIRRAGEPGAPATLSIYDDSMAYPAGAFLYSGANPSHVLGEILKQKPDLHLALARRFPGFRECVVADVIKTVSKENSMFALATAIPSIVPLLSLPFAVGEFASDTAFLTMNQVRMAFLLAGASGREVGYRAQKSEIASIIASAFGWRALARELISKIPLGGGMVAKGAIAFAGTFVVGASIERLYRVGYGYNVTEREAAYKEAFERGKQVVSGMLEAYKQKRAPQLQ